MPSLFHPLQDRVERREAARDALGLDGFAGEDAVAIEELPRAGGKLLGGRRLPEEQGADQGPAARDLRREQRAGAEADPP